MRGHSLLILGWLAGCRADLLPNELVLGDEIAAVIVTGEAGSDFGTSVAIGPAGILVGAPGTGQVHLLCEEGEKMWTVQGQDGFGRRVWWVGDEPWAWQRGGGVWRLALDGSALEQIDSRPQWTHVDICPDGTIAGVDGVGEMVACEREGVIWTECGEERCRVFWQSSDLDTGVGYDAGDNEELSQTVLGTTTPGSAVGFVDGVPCWGDVDMGNAASQSTGAMTCWDGATISGFPGDHLGVSMAGDRVAGVFNKWEVPARARVVSLQDDQPSWAIDRASERSRLSLDYHEAHERWAVGVPGFGASSARQGRVFLVTDP